jgi:hypothetical protein
VKTLRQLVAVSVEMFRDGPRLLAEWLDRLTQEINGPKDGPS